MGDVPGIAGSAQPEVDGIFVARSRFEAGLFVELNRTGGAVDIWGLDEVDAGDFVTSETGYVYVPYVVDSGRLELLEQDLWVSAGMSSTPVITSENSPGTVTTRSADGTEVTKKLWWVSGHPLEE
jgi:hypothetical protein